ncbi:MAG TPA: tyrosine-type recombinase/integrase [Myxococcota bacterium]|nr:tyrosine-type recombinase/integrase [Myxococcota bacterium]
MVKRDPETGLLQKEWVDRRKGCRTRTIALQLQREVEDSAALGKSYQPLPEPADMRGIAVAWLKSGKEQGRREATLRHRASLLEDWIVWWGERPISDLSLARLEEYSRSLPAEGRQASTRHRKVLVVEQLWTWAWQRRGEYPGLPEPARLTGEGGLAPPAPVVASAAPTWLEVDRMISHLLIPWHRKAALLMRYLGLRTSQVCGLRWSDLDVERGVLRVRSGVRGAKKGRSRVVPIHPALSAELRAWPRPEDASALVFPRRYKDKDKQPRQGPYRGDALVEPFRRAWTLAEVPVDRWDIPDGDDPDLERGHGSPTHAIRRCIRSELLRAGVQEAVALHLVGHSSGHTAAAYVPETSPEQSPWWPRLLAAVMMIPPHDPLPD